jgi:hypothetical protein
MAISKELAFFFFTLFWTQVKITFAAQRISFNLDFEFKQMLF